MLWTGCVVLPVVATTAPSDSLSAAFHFPCIGYRKTSCSGRRPEAEEGLSSSEDNLLAVPRPLRREVLRHPLQVPRCFPWPSPFRNRLGSSLFRSIARTGTTTLVRLHSRCGPASCHRLHAMSSFRFDTEISLDVGNQLPRTLASPRTGLSPAGCPQLVARLRHVDLLVFMAPELLDALRYVAAFGHPREQTTRS